MKHFIDFLREEDEKEGTVDEHVFDKGNDADERPVSVEKPAKAKPVFAKPMREDVGGMVAPAVPPGPNGAPGGILGPGSDAVMPTVINVNAPAHRFPPGHHPHGPGHRPPPRCCHYGPMFIVPYLGTVKKLKKWKSKKSKKSKNSATRKPKNPYNTKIY